MADFLSTLFGGGAEAEAAAKDRAALATYQGQAGDVLGSTYNQGRTDLTSGINAYAPLAQLGQTYSAAAPTYMAALGTGTPEQQAAALASFKSAPGYQAMLDANSQAVARQRAVGGMGASGNADIDAMMGAAGITSQQYQNWLQNLQGAGQMGINATGTAAAGQAGGYGSLAQLGQQYGQNMSGVYSNVATGDIGANNLQAAGEAAGAKNLLGAGLSIASLAMGGGGLGGLGSMLSGGGTPSTGMTFGGYGGGTPGSGMMGGIRYPAL